MSDIIEVILLGEALFLICLAIWGMTRKGNNERKI